MHLPAQPPTDPQQPPFPQDGLLPLFPLQTVLFPGSLLALQIFEVRYLDMVLRCHQSGQPFGVVSLIKGAEVRKAQGAGDVPAIFHSVGTLAQIEQLERPQPGLLRIRCRGTERFEVSQPKQLPHGLWVGTQVPMAPDAAVAVPEHLQHSREALRQWWDALQTQHGEGPPEGLPIQAPFLWDDCGWLSNRLAELLPLPALTRQHLMALDNPLLRLELVSDILDAK